MTRRLRVGVLLVVSLLVAFPVVAQKTVRRIFVSVQSVNGAPQLDLSTADFHVTEQGVERPVTRARLATTPMRVVLLVDASTSISGMLIDFRNALREFLDALPPEHEVAFVSVGGQLRVRVPPTTDRDKLQKAVAMFSSDGGANVFIDSLLEADRRFLWNVPERWPAFVIITTDIMAQRGEAPIDEFNDMTTDFRMRAGSAHAVVIRGTNAGGLNTEIARNLVGNTGGIFEQIAITNSLSDHLRNIAARLASDHQAMARNYEVEYASSVKGLEPPPIEVRVSRESTRLRLSYHRPF